jgi:hypothetical protein
MQIRWMSLMCAGVLMTACPGKDEGETTNANPDDDGSSSADDEQQDDDDDDDGDDDDGETAAPETGDDSDTDAPGTSDDGATDDGQVFIERPDGGGVAVECDVWAQDCPVGQKCMPWANDGGNAWNATRCTEVDENPGQVGDECQVEGSGVSGIDTCDISSMCYYVDPETNIGQCVGFCQGSQANPVCDPGFVCSIVNDGVLILCRPECDPLLQDCVEGAACLPAGGSDLFTCIIDASGEAGATGDACEFLNACDPGLFCADAAALVGCDGATGCCSEFCDLDAPDPNSFCSVAGTECIPYHEEGTAPPQYTHVGVCVVPA